MKRAAAGLFLSFLFLFFASNRSYAEPSGCVDKIVKGMHEEGMPMTGRMEHRGRSMMGFGHGMWRLFGKLGLDEKQKEAIRVINNRVTKDTIRKRADMQIARVELRDILHKDQVDMNAAEAKLKQIASLMTDIRLSHIRAMEEMKAQLTPEQKEKFKLNLDKWKQQRGRHGDHGRTPRFDKEENLQPGKEDMPY